MALNYSLRADYPADSTRLGRSFCCFVVDGHSFALLKNQIEQSAS